MVGSSPERLVVCGAEGWFVATPPGDEQHWPSTGVIFCTTRPAIHLQDLVVGVRVVGVKSYAGEQLLMLIFERWRTLWLERGDLLVVQPEQLVLLSNQSAIPGEPHIRLLTLAHPYTDPQALLAARCSLERLQAGRRLFGLGWGAYRHLYLQQLGVEALPLSSRYFPEEIDSLWGHLLLNYPESLICLERHRRPTSLDAALQGTHYGLSR